MDIKEFTADFFEQIDNAVEMGGDYDEELTNSILDYIIDNGEVSNPELCFVKQTKMRLNAYDYNEDANSLDLFYLLKVDKPLAKANKREIEKGFNYLTHFFNEVTSGKFETPEANGELEEVTNLIKDAQTKIDVLRVYVLTNGLAEEDSEPNSVEIDCGDRKIEQEFHVWDMQRVFRQNSIKAGKEKVNIDFPVNYGIELQCLKMSECNDAVDAYLAIIPGDTLAKIYNQYHQALLEKNVRTFLQFKGKVNKSIHDTLKNQPDMFFSYNNGISTTASEITTRENEDGAMFITNLNDWQIVNGGQTTASIAATSKESGVDISHVYVPMKISVIKDKENADSLVKNISTCANSQTAIKNSDFSANDPYLVELENLSRTIWHTDGNGTPVNKWYFERTRGQYSDELAQLRGVDEKRFKQEYPKQQKFTKTEMAKYMVCWEQRPYEVGRGAENNYQQFVKDVKRLKPNVTERYFRHLVAKAILYNSIDKIVKDAQLGGYKANVNAYIMSAVSLKTQKQLDLDKIWEKQQITAEMEQLIRELLPVVWNVITTMGGSQNVTEFAKKQDCWNELRIKLSQQNIEANDSILSKTNMEEYVELNNAQKDKVTEAETITPETFFAIANWLKSHNAMTPIDRKAAFNFGTWRSRGKGFTIKQAQYALKIVDKAKELGYTE